MGEIADMHLLCRFRTKILEDEEATACVNERKQVRSG